MDLDFVSWSRALPTVFNSLHISSPWNSIVSRSCLSRAFCMRLKSTSAHPLTTLADMSDTYNMSSPFIYNRDYNQTEYDESQLFMSHLQRSCDITFTIYNVPILTLYSSPIKLTFPNVLLLILSLYICCSSGSWGSSWYLSSFSNSSWHWFISFLLNWPGCCGSQRCQIDRCDSYIWPGDGLVIECHA